MIVPKATNVTAQAQRWDTRSPEQMSLKMGPDQRQSQRVRR